MVGASFAHLYIQHCATDYHNRHSIWLIEGVRVKHNYASTPERCVVLFVRDIFAPKRRKNELHTCMVRITADMCFEKSKTGVTC